MAKKDKETIFNEYLAELKELNPALEEILKDDKVSAKLKTGVLAQSEFSSQMDALKAERESFAAEVTEAKTRIEGWQKWYGDTSKQVADVQGELKQYKEAFGDLEPDVQRKVAREQGLSVDDFNKRLNDEINKRDLYNLKFATDLVGISLEHSRRFKGETLNAEDVYKVAGENNLDLKTAYKEYISERVAEQQKVEIEEGKKKAAEEAVAEYASKHGLPIVPSHSDLVHVLDAKDVQTNPADRVRAAVSGFMANRR